MTNPEDPAYAHEGSQIAVSVELAKIFPGCDEKIVSIQHRYSGLTKREYFAAMAMQGMLSHPETDKLVIAKDFAKCSLEMADALVTELNK